MKWKAVQTECTVTTVSNTLSKQHWSNWSDDPQVHNGTYDTVSDHVSIVEENSNDHRISDTSYKETW